VAWQVGSGISNRRQASSPATATVVAASARVEAPRGWHVGGPSIVVTLVWTSFLLPRLTLAASTISQVVRAYKTHLPGRVGDNDGAGRSSDPPHRPDGWLRHCRNASGGARIRWGRQSAGSGGVKLALRPVWRRRAAQLGPSAFRVAPKERWWAPLPPEFFPLFFLLFWWIAPPGSLFMHPA